MGINVEKQPKLNAVRGSSGGQGADIRIRRIEICHLELRYAHIRVQNPQAELRLAASFQSYGQLMPILVVAVEPPSHILIDGYLRVAAAKRCGNDTLLAQIWQGNEQDALVHVLAKTAERRWDVFEEAGLIKELHTHYQLSQSRIAAVLGKNQSWVSRRLTLMNTLPEEILKSVQRGNISTWAANRVLTPMARANMEHTKVLAANLMKERISTRNLFVLFHHYKKSNRKTRAKMVQQPQLFLKALEAGKQDNLAKQLKDGPEGQWLCDIKMVAHIIRRLIKKAPLVIYAGQSTLDKRCFFTAFEETKDIFLSLDRKIRSIRDDIREQEATGNGTASIRVRDKTNQSSFEDIP